MSTNAIDKFIVSLINKAPPWARNCAYALLLLAGLFYLFVPTEIGGTISEPYNGGLRAVDDIMVSVDRGSVRYYVSATPDGTWKVPSPSRFPGDHDIDFRTRQDLSFSIGTIRTCIYDFLPGSTIKANFNAKASAAKIVRVDKNCPASAADTIASAEPYHINISPISEAIAQAQSVNIDLSTIQDGVARVLEQKSTRSETQDQLSKLGISSTELAAADKSQSPTLYLERIATLKSVERAPSIYMYAGSVGADGNWQTQNLSPLDSYSDHRLIPGLVVKADTGINLRNDYIRWSWFSWRNAEKIGEAKPGDNFVIRNSKVIGEHLWVEAVPVQIE
jgi:hypothetical protein